MLQKAIEFDAEEVINKCLQVIAKNFNYIVTSSSYSSSSSTTKLNPFHNLPIHILIRLTKSDNLAVASEFTVYSVVAEYVKMHREQLKTEDIVVLFETVRFPFLSFEQLKEVESNTDVPRHLLTEALLERLKKHEGQQQLARPHHSGTLSSGSSNSNININSVSPPDDEKDEMPSMLLASTTPSTSSAASVLSRLQPRAAYSISLEYTHDMDDKGVFYYIGTKGTHTSMSVLLPILN
jgi:hypothetical protein